MKKMDKEKILKELNYTGSTGMSVCNSCASCGGCGSSCQSTCKCFDQNSKVENVREIYTK